jgi:hypothetical protein
MWLNYHNNASVLLMYVSKKYKSKHIKLVHVKQKLQSYQQQIYKPQPKLIDWFSLIYEKGSNIIYTHYLKRLENYRKYI